MKYFFVVIAILLSFNISSAQTSNKRQVKYSYQLYVPKEYNNNNVQGKKWPLIIYLHGRSIRGNNLEKLNRYGLPNLVSKGWNFPFIIASPQCPGDRNWDTDDWFSPMFKELKTKYNIDPSRIYLTGMSMGGCGVWSLAMSFPNVFAALIPLCGGGNPKNIDRIKNIPVWAFHGTQDHVVPMVQTEQMVKALQKINGKVKFTKVRGVGHGLQKVYEDYSIYDWLLHHVRH